jgi:hypothetical protein
MIGMTIAVATTLVTHSIASLPEIAVAIAWAAASASSSRGASR